MSCSLRPLNGFGANTEGGRLNNKSARICDLRPRLGVGPGLLDRPCTPRYADPTNPVQVPITQSAGSYIDVVQGRCEGVLLGSAQRTRGLSQASAMALLAAVKGKPTSEGVRIKNLQDSFEIGGTCGAAIGDVPHPIITVVCPPLPPPPAPPSRACPLPKNERF
jgi:hypothetical protein